jgi:hypothetical protein
MENTDNNESGQADDSQISSNEHVHRSSHHRHRSGRSSSGQQKKVSHSRKKSSFETIVAKHLLKIIGVLFFLGGLLWLVFKSESLPFVAKLIRNFFTVVEDGENIIASSSASSTGDVAIQFSFLIHLLPGILILAYAYINKFVLKGQNWLTMTAFYLGTTVLFATHLFESFYGLFVLISLPYPNLTYAIVTTFLIAIPVIYFTAITHKAIVHLFTIAFIYITIVFLAIGYGSSSHQLFILIFIFSALLYYFTGKHTGSTINTTNGYFAIGYFALYFIRKMYISNSPDLIWFYVGYTTAMYLTIMLIRIIKPYRGENILKSYYKDSIIIVATLYYFVTVWYVLAKFDLSHFQWVFAVLLTAVNYFLLQFNRKVAPDVNRAPYYYAAILIAAAIVPLLVHTGQLIIYASMASLLFIVYSKYRNNHFAGLTAVGLLSFAMIVQLIKTVLVYYPAVYFESDLLPSQPFVVNLLSGIAVTLAAFVVNHYFVRISFSYSQKWFSRTNTSLYITTLFYASLYLTAFWLIQYLFFAVWNVKEAQIISWYAFHVTFLLLLQLFVLERKSWVYKPFLWISIVSIFAMPLVINFFLIELRNIALSFGGETRGGFNFHFYTILPLTALVFVTTSNLNAVYKSFKERATLILLFRIGFFVYLFLAEYDHFTVISSNTLHSGDDIIKSNHYLPYSIVFYLTSLVLVLFSFVRNIKLLRQLSLLVLFFTILKVFVIDFSSFSSTGQVIAFWMTGGLLLLYSFIYQQLRKFNFETSAASSSSSRRSSRHRSESRAEENEKND